MQQPLVTTTRLELIERADGLNQAYAGRETLAVIEAVLRHEFPSKAAVVSSFGTESAILLHLIAEVDRGTPIIFLDTLRHFEGTVAYKAALTERLGLERIIEARPDPVQVQAIDPGGNLAERDPDACCHMRKTVPMLRTLQGFRCVFTGRKRFQASTRASLELFDIQDRWIRVNPLAGWSKDDLDAYFERHDLPRHPLEGSGYRSIGCEPCTKPVEGTNGYRDGRWAGHDKTECGIHFVTDADGAVRMERRGPAN